MGNHKRIMGNHKGITRVDDGILESYDKDTHIKYHDLLKQTTKSKTREKE